jgi:hypothetical protein
MTPQEPTTKPSRPAWFDLDLDRSDDYANPIEPAALATTEDNRC